MIIRTIVQVVKELRYFLYSQTDW